jgi:hypothetical protein
MSAASSDAVKSESLGAGTVSNLKEELLTGKYVKGGGELSATDRATKQARLERYIDDLPDGNPKNRRSGSKHS